MFLLLTAIAATVQLSAAPSGALDVYGAWIIPPDEEGGPNRGIVTIADEGDGPVGTITAVGEALRDEPGAADAVGMRILWGFEADEDVWKSGRILDPEKDKTYRAKIKRDGDTLSVKGCIAFFCREQVWLSANTENAD